MVVPSPHDSVSLDISGNLLHGYFAQKDLDRKAQSRRVAGAIASMVLSVVLITGVGVHWLSARAAYQDLRQSPEAIAFASANPDSKPIAVPDEVRSLPTQYGETNNDVILKLGHLLASRAPGMSLVSLRYSVDPLVGAKITGQAEAPELANVRSYLNQFAAAVPEMEGMITTVARPAGNADQGKLLIDFEIQRALSPKGGSQ